MMENTKGMEYIAPDSDKLSYMGRIDDSDPTAYKMIFAGSSVTIRFKGTEVGMVIDNHRYYFINQLGILVDGKESKITIDEHEKDVYINIAGKLEDTQHEIVVFKRQDATHYFDFKGFYIKGEVLDKLSEPERKIECYGDSVSAGAVCEAVENTAALDPEDHEAIYDNAWHSYSMITARNLGAQINNIAQGGIAIFDGTGYYHAPDHIGMESAYDKLCYFPEGGITNWDFKKYTPNVVIFAVGQNDAHFEGHDDIDIDDEQYREKWKAAYKKIIKDLMEKYPKAVFVLILTVLQHAVGWDKAVEEIADELDDRVKYLRFKRAGKATPGHPRLSEQQEMAEELTAFISKLGDDVWK